MHTNHNWKEACLMDYDNFKQKTQENEDEANDYAISVLEKLKEFGFDNQIDCLLFEVGIVRVKNKNMFDETYGSIYKNIGTELSFSTHIGEVI